MKEEKKSTIKEFNSTAKPSIEYNDFNAVATLSAGKEKRRYFNSVSAFIVDWQVPLPTDEL